MKHLVKLLMVTFLLSAVGLVYAQGPVDKTKDETVKAKSVTTKDTKGSSAGRLGDDTDEPAKDTGSDEAVKEKKSFFGKLFGGKSTPEGQASKSAASSRGGSAKKGGGKTKSSSSGAPAKDSGEKGIEERGQEKEDDGG